MYASIKDVAALAGVSFQTASKVLNGRTGVASAATHSRILNAAHELGYVPNALARGLVHQTSTTIGILSDDFSDVAIARFVVGAQRSVESAGHASLVASTPPGGDHSLLLRRLQEHRVQGILLVAPSLEGDSRLAEALPTTLPIVSLSHIAGAQVVLVGSDHRESGILAAQHLLALGHSRVATVVGSGDRQVTHRRLEGFRETLLAGGVSLDAGAVVETDWTILGGRGAAHRLLDNDPGITAIFAQSDLMALGDLRAQAERGERVPEDCSVVGCDDQAIAEFLSPPLSTVRVPFEETGALGALLLLRGVRGEKVPQRELLPVTFVERASTAPPPGRRKAPPRRRTARKAAVSPPAQSRGDSR
jgi:LacI family transcriptional regulator